LIQTARIAALCAALLLPASAQAGVYKWTDDKGRVHYSDQPPAASKAEQVRIRINSYTGPAIVSKSGAAAAPPGEVVIYTTEWCGYCKKAKAFMDSKGVRYREVDVETSQDGRQEFAKLGGRGVPVILVGDQRMDGYDQGRLEAMLQAAGRSR